MLASASAHRLQASTSPALSLGCQREETKGYDSSLHGWVWGWGNRAPLLHASPQIAVLGLGGGQAGSIWQKGSIAPAAGRS